MTPTRDDAVAQSSSDAEPGVAAGFEDTEDEDWASAADHRSSPDQGGGPSTSRTALPSARSRLMAEEGDLYPTRSATPPITAETAYRTSQPGRRPDPADRGTVPPSRANSLHARNRRANDPRSNRLSTIFSSFIPHRNQQSTPEPRMSRARSPLSVEALAPEAPPPSLPSPTLAELGMSLTVLTPSLSPSHFATPPTNGTFMQPHFLLLCHSQGLDVLPLVGPPAPHAYALVRRVAFKSVLVMEERGVLVAIAGRRDGVRVYALEEVRKAIEWRMEVEIQRERDRARREEARSRPSFVSVDVKGKSKPRTPGVYEVTLPPTDPVPPRPPPAPRQKSTKPNRSPPPHYNNLSNSPTTSTHPLRPQPSISNLTSSRNILNRPEMTSSISRRVIMGDSHEPDEKADKGDWMEDPASDDEPLIAAGPSGSAALDERTSSGQPTVSAAPHTDDAPQDDADDDMAPGPVPVGDVATPPALIRNRRPTNLNLSPIGAGTLASDQAVTPLPVLSTTPAPTLFSLQRALFSGPPSPQLSQTLPPTRQNEVLSLAQVLNESRIQPDTPPSPTGPTVNFRGSSRRGPDLNINAEGAARVPLSRTQSNIQDSSPGNRRRWSIFGEPPRSPTSMDTPRNMPSTPASSGTLMVPTQSRNANGHSAPSTPTRPQSSSSRALRTPSRGDPPPSSRPPTTTPGKSPRRFLPKLFGSAFRGSSETSRKNPTSQPPIPSEKTPVSQTPNGTSSTHAPAPKMEYVKLPGTKGSLAIKAVETAKKSFLAILCGESGEKVELFAGTYRTALGLSRTFILPDSPRSLELQLQGDDLVELFLVFAQNVFGLEPATVRVREVRIGRAERREARRRAAARNALSAPHPADRDAEGTGEGRDGMGTLGDENTTNVITTVVTVGPEAQAGAAGHATSSTTPRRSVGVVRTPVSAHGSHPKPEPPLSAVPPANPPPTAAEESAKAAAQFGPYTTFQQLSFAPNFPLGCISDEYINPPTYPSFVQYEDKYEPGRREEVMAAHVDIPRPATPAPYPALPPSPPPPEPEVQWFYRDPRGVVQGPWEPAVMHAWFLDGFLPPDLPVRRDSENKYISLVELGAITDPNDPFLATRPAVAPAPVPIPQVSEPPATPTSQEPQIPISDILLAPMSMLDQPKHFGPPAYFFSTRGGHSTSIVDARGRPVLKGRFTWSVDDDDDDPDVVHLGDVKRLEAFDIDNRAVIVALRQGGLEAVDIGDALLGPADNSRSRLPFFSTLPNESSRRKNYVWRLGSPVEDTSATYSTAGIQPRTETVLSKKSSSGPSRKIGSSKRGDTSLLNGDDPATPNAIPDEDVLFLGRNADHVYFCERSAGAFRILRLAPVSAT